MSEQYVAVVRRTDDDLTHYKYLRREKTASGKWRYIYEEPKKDGGIQSIKSISKKDLRAKQRASAKEARKNARDEKAIAKTQAKIKNKKLKELNSNTSNKGKKAASNLVSIKEMPKKVQRERTKAAKEKEKAQKQYIKDIKRKTTKVKKMKKKR